MGAEMNPRVMAAETALACHDADADEAADEVKFFHAVAPEGEAEMTATMRLMFAQSAAREQREQLMHWAVVAQRLGISDPRGED